MQERFNYLSFFISAGFFAPRLGKKLLFLYNWFRRTKKGGISKWQTKNK